MSEIKDRLLQFLKYKKLGQQKFETSIGMSNGWANKVGDSIRKTTLNKIIEVYPDLNLIWLKTGIGQMIGDSEVAMDDSFIDNQDSIDADRTAKVVPILPISAQGGTLNDFVVSVKDSDCEYVVSPIKGAEYAMPISGDSMAPEYPAGSTVFIKRINEKAFIDWGRVYVLDTCNGTVIKTLVPGDTKNFVKCLSINRDPKFAPFEVNLSDVYGIYRVLLCMALK